VRIPVWLTFTIAAFVVLFGAYRIKLGLTMSPEEEAAARKRGGLYGMGKRFHLFIGVIYLVMGGIVTAMALGWQPWGNHIGPSTQVPSKDKAPTTSGVPTDSLPTKK
jgi:hypothetical protein